MGDRRHNWNNPNVGEELFEKVVWEVVTFFRYFNLESLLGCFPKFTKILPRYPKLMVL